MVLNRRAKGYVSFTPKVVNGKAVYKPRRVFWWIFAIIAIALTIIGFEVINPDLGKLFGSMSILGKRVSELVDWTSSTFNSVDSHGVKYVDHAFKILWDTIIASVAGTVFGVVIGFPFAVLAASNIIKFKPLNIIIKIILAILRTVPIFVFSLIFVWFFDYTILSVTLSVIVFTFAITTKMIYDRIEQVENGPFEQMQSTGANRWQSFRIAVMPQIGRHFVSTAFYALEVNIRYISIIGLVINIGIGKEINDQIANLNYDKAGFLLLLLILTVLVIEFIAWVAKYYIWADQDYVLDANRMRRTRAFFTWRKFLPKFVYFYWFMLSTKTSDYDQYCIQKMNLRNERAIKKGKILAAHDGQRTRNWKLAWERRCAYWREIHQLHAWFRLEMRTLKLEYKRLKQEKHVIYQNERSTKLAEYRLQAINFRHDYQMARQQKQPVRIYDDRTKRKLNLRFKFWIWWRTDILAHQTATFNIMKQVVNDNHKNFNRQLTVSYVQDSAPAKFLKRYVFGACVLALFIYSCTQIHGHVMDAESINKGLENLRQILTPNWKSFFGHTPQNGFNVDGNVLPYSAFELIVETIMIAFVGTLLGVIFAIILGMLGSYYVTGKYISKIFWLIATVIRPIPSYLYAIILVSLVGFGPFTGVLALMVSTMGMLSKYIRESFNDIDPKILEALSASGVNPFFRFIYGVIPQVAANIVSWWIYRFDINIREAGILGVVSAGHFGFILNSYFTSFEYNDFATLLYSMIVMALIFELLINICRAKILYDRDPKWIHWIYKKCRRAWAPLYIINYKKVKQTTEYPKVSFNQLRAEYLLTNGRLTRKAWNTIWQKATPNRVEISREAWHNYELRKLELAEELAIWKVEHRQMIQDCNWFTRHDKSRLKTDLRIMKIKAKTAQQKQNLEQSAYHVKTIRSYELAYDLNYAQYFGLEIDQRWDYLHYAVLLDELTFAHRVKKLQMLRHLAAANGQYEKHEANHRAKEVLTKQLHKAQGINDKLSAYAKYFAARNLAKSLYRKVKLQGIDENYR